MTSWRPLRLAGGELHGKKVLIFTYYKDTARYLYRDWAENAAQVAQSIGDPVSGAWTAAQRPKIAAG